MGFLLWLRNYRESAIWVDHSVVKVDSNGPIEGMCLIPIADGTVLSPQFPLASLPLPHYLKHRPKRSFHDTMIEI